MVATVERPAAVRVVLVPVHPTEEHRPPVDQQTSVDDSDGPEADGQGDGLALGRVTTDRSVPA